MKRKTAIFILIIIVIMFGLFMLGIRPVVITGSKAHIRYKHGETAFYTEVSEEESKEIKSILNFKVQIFDEPSCGFNTDIVIEFGNQSFSPACDGCGIVKVNNSGKYIGISKKDKEKIVDIFEKYGGKFPCV